MTIKQIRRNQTRQVNQAYNDLINELANIFSDLKLKDNQLFRLEYQPSYKKKLATEAFRKYRKRIESIIKESQRLGWEESHKEFKEKLIKRLESVKSKLTDKEFQRQLEAIEALRIDYAILNRFSERKINRATISERVWDIQDLAKQNIEIALTDALGKGKSAQQLARSIKHNLNRPDALFRRVRNSKGKLMPSREMRKYKPGQGVYRSAHKNALRLARNEINIAYRTSEQNSMRSNNDIVGQKISISPTANRECDICDELQGVYPKDFNWSGWHIQCLCVRTFIQKTDAEFVNEIKSGKSIKPDSSNNFVKDVPDSFKEWYKKDGSKMKRKPNFLKDNGY